MLEFLLVFKKTFEMSAVFSLYLDFLNDAISSIHKIFSALHWQRIPFLIAAIQKVQLHFVIEPKLFYFKERLEELL